MIKNLEKKAFKSNKYLVNLVLYLIALFIYQLTFINIY